MAKTTKGEIIGTRAAWAAQQYTREQWLMERAGEIADYFEACGLLFPWIIRVSCGWPGVVPGGRIECVKAVTYDAEMSADCAREIFISPMLTDSVEIVGVLAHEMVHAILMTSAQHGDPFLTVCNRAGLTEGEPEQRLPGPELMATLRAHLANADAYPHAALTPPPPQPGQVIVVTINDKGEQSTRTAQEGSEGSTEGMSIGVITREKEVKVNANGERVLTLRCQCGSEAYVLMKHASRGLPFCQGCRLPYTVMP